MGILDKVLGEFIDVIEWTDDSTDTLVYRFPTYNKEIQMGSSLIVRESQKALFVYKGEIADLYEAGHHKLSTESMPIMTTLRHWTHGFNTPFKSDVYYFNTRQYTDVKWGTPNPITLRDPEFGALRIRAFGNYTMRVTDPAKMMKEISGTEERYTLEQIEGQLRGSIISRFTDFIAESKVPFLDYAANMNEFSTALNPIMQSAFESFGLAMENFNVINVSLPPEVEKVLDQRAGMSIIDNDMDKFTKFQIANAIPEAAQGGGDGGGMAGAGVGAGIGMAIGNVIAGSVAQSAPQQAAPQQGASAPAEQKIMVRCPECSSLSEETSKFCAECGYKLIK